RSACTRCRTLSSRSPASRSAPLPRGHTREPTVPPLPGERWASFACSAIAVDGLAETSQPRECRVLAQEVAHARSGALHRNGYLARLLGDGGLAELLEGDFQAAARVHDGRDEPGLEAGGVVDLCHGG